MKGAMSSIESRLWEALSKHLTPDLPYSHNSGGDPKEIPNLTYEGLIDFHRNFYPPFPAVSFSSTAISLLQDTWISFFQAFKM